MYQYYEIAKEIERRIKTGVYQVGELLPSRSELTVEFRVARATLDHAFAHLKQYNVISCQRGVGTIANSPDKQKLVVYFLGIPETAVRNGCRIPYPVLLPEEYRRKSVQEKIRSSDGVLWFLPESADFSLIRQWHGCLPQVIVNRNFKGFDCVSTDDSGSYYQITKQRLAEHPEGVFIFLQTQFDFMPSRYRLEGFIKACREAGVFYELWNMPVDFYERCRELERHLDDLPPVVPRVIFSDSLFNTGSVMFVANKYRWQWKKDYFYCDFDDDLPSYFWGTEVTSFVQDYKELIDRASKRLEKMVRMGNTCTGSIELIPACMHQGNT